MLSEEQRVTLKEWFDLDDDAVEEWLEDEGEEGVLKVLKAIGSDEEEKETKADGPKHTCICPKCGHKVELGIGEECRKHKCPKCGTLMKKGEKEEKKKKPEDEEDEEEYPEKEKAAKADTALRAIAKLLKSIEPEKVRSRVAKLLARAGLDLAKYGYGKYEYGAPAKKALEDLTEKITGLETLVMERDANLATIVDGLVDATKDGNVEALEAFKTLLQEKGVKTVRESDEDEELTDEEQKVVDVAKKAIKEVMDEKAEGGGFQALYNDPRFQSDQK